jgi:hypothetical protein
MNQFGCESVALPEEWSFFFLSRSYTQTMRHLVDIGDHAEKEVIQ